MPTESLMCPSCGAPLSLRPEDTLVTCAHCGSPVRIQTNVDGQIFATLEVVRARTDYLYAESEIKKWQDRLDVLKAERRRISDQATEKGKQRDTNQGCVIYVIMFAALALGVYIMATNSKLVGLGILIILVGIGFIGWYAFRSIFGNANRTVQEIKQQAQDVDRQIDEATRQIVNLRIQSNQAFSAAEQGGKIKQ